jgi:hypothetical protein
MRSRGGPAAADNSTQGGSSLLQGLLRAGSQERSVLGGGAADDRSVRAGQGGRSVRGGGGRGTPRERSVHAGWALLPVPPDCPAVDEANVLLSTPCVSAGAGGCTVEGPVQWLASCSKAT